MPFDPQGPISRDATEIRSIKIEMFDSIETGEPEERRWIRYEIAANDQFGIIMGFKRGDLLPHLPPVIKQQLLDFIDWVRTKAEQEILP